MKRSIAALATMLLIAGGAHAVTITGSYTVSETPVAGGTSAQPSISYNLNHTSFSKTLTVANGESGAVAFFTTTPAGSCNTSCVTSPATGTHHAVAKDTLTVNFSLFENGTPLVPQTTSTALADYVADYSNTTDSDIWRNATNNTTPPCTPSGKGVDGCLVLAFNLPDGSGNVFNVIVNNAADWAITPTISFQLTSGSSGGGGAGRAPEPASLALLGTALVGLGLLRRRQRSV